LRSSSPQAKGRVEGVMERIKTGWWKKLRPRGIHN
jgi:hypothetical protein